MILTDEQIDKLIEALDSIAIDYDEYGAGLPRHEEAQMALMRATVRKALEPDLPPAPEGWEPGMPGTVFITDAKRRMLPVHESQVTRETEGKFDKFDPT